jgi:hypothetical protein
MYARNGSKKQKYIIVKLLAQTQVIDPCIYVGIDTTVVSIDGIPHITRR